MSVYHQDAVIDQLNRFLTYRQSTQQLKKGYCHGLTLLWLDKISRGKEQCFYDTVKLIVECKDDDDFAKHEKKILAFIKRIEWLQNSKKYTHEMTQLDIDKLLGLPDKFSLSYLFNAWQLKFTLDFKIKNNKMICLSGRKHSLGIYKKDGCYYLYDSNHDDGVAQSYQNIDALQEAIIASLFTHKEIENDCYPIDINIVSRTASQKNKHKSELFTYLVKTTEDVNKSTRDKTTNLLLACTRRDNEEIRILLKHGAYVNQSGKNGLTPLYVAAEYGELTAVNLLLHYGATPLQPLHNGFTALSTALAHKQFAVVIRLLLHISCNHDFNNVDREALRLAEQEVIHAIAQAWPALKAKEKNHLKKMAHDLYQLNYKHGFFTAQRRDTPRKKIQRPIPRLFNLRNGYEELNYMKKNVNNAYK